MTDKAIEALERLHVLALMDESDVVRLNEREETWATQWDRGSATIRAALEQGEAKPVAWMMCWRGNHFTADKEKAAQWMSHDMDEDVPVIPLYAAPPSTAEQWKPSGAEYDRNIHHNTDASAWADFFMATFPNCGADRDMMLGWFANAMMAVADSRPSTAEAQARALEGFAKKMLAEAALYRATSDHAAGLYFAAEQADAEAKRIREEAK